MVVMSFIIFMRKIDIIIINNMNINMNSKEINNLTYLLGYWKNSWTISPHKFHLSHLTAKSTHIIGQHLSSTWFNYNCKIEHTHTFIVLEVAPDVTSKAIQQKLNSGGNIPRINEYFIIEGNEMRKYLGGKYLQLKGRLNSDNKLNFSIHPQRDVSKVSLTLPNFILQTSTSC